MKERLFLFGLSLVILTCGNQESTEHKFTTKTNKSFLEDLTELAPQDFDSLFSLNMFSASTVPFYTPDGILIPESERYRIISSGEFLTTVYVDDKKNSKLWVVKFKPIKEATLTPDTNYKKKPSSSLINQTAISFSTTDISGKKYSLESCKGKVVVMNFWFIGCYPCIKEIPKLNKLVNKYQGKNVLFLAFALDKKERLLPFLNKNHFNYTIIPESQTISDNYDVNIYPTHIIIDKDLTIRFYSIGTIESGKKNVLEEEVEKVLSEN